MYLSDLEIIGFKSFAQRTKFKLTDGMTAFVGPNGCGKTNVVDAIRWVLGEQKSSVLRSDIMEDVIFNGTSKRKPLGMAEVSLTLQNNKHILPTEYNEVTISRRLFRNGDSHYLLNNTQCRLRDVLDLFMDTGMGADSYSVIELKMVEAILSGKPEERRSLVEEAAGVKKYKLRRKEASKKLQNVQQDLIRVSDIVAEVEKLVNSLSRQAAKTRRYNKLTEQLKALEVNLLFHQYSNYKSGLFQLNSVFEELKSKKSEKENELNEFENSLNGLREELSSLDSNYQSTLEEENENNILMADKVRDIAVDNEKITSLINSQDRITKELDEFTLSFGNLENHSISVEKSLDNVNEQLSKIAYELSEKESIRDDARSKVKDARDGASLTNEEVIGFQNRIDSINNDLERAKNRKESLERSISESKSEVDSLKSGLSAVQNEILVEKQKSADFQLRLADAENALKTAHEHEQSLQTKMEELREEIATENNKLSGQKASLEFLMDLADSDESTKYLLKESGWGKGRKIVSLAELVGVDDDLIVAVDASLGEYSKYLVVENKIDAGSAIALLKENKKGKAAFICKELIPKVKPPEEITISAGIIGWASEIVRCDDDIRNALRIILGKTLLVKNTETAWNIINTGLCDCAVTPDGEIVRNSAFIRGGSKLKSEGLAIGKQERIQKITDEINKLESSISILDSNLRNLKSEFESINIMELNNRLRIIESEKNTHEHQINQLVYKHEGIENTIGIMEKNSGMFTEEIKSIDEETISNLEQLKEFDKALIFAKEQQLSKSSELQQLEHELEQKEEEFHEVEMKKVRYGQEIISLEKEIESISSRKAELESTQMKRKEEFNQAGIETEELKSGIIEMEASLSNLKEIAESIQIKREFTGKEINALKEQITGYSSDLNLRRKEFDKLTESIHQQDLKVSEVKNKLEYVKNRAFEGYEIDIETAEIILDETFSIDQIKHEVNDIKDKLTALGNVNFMALEEFETQNERLQFYNKQVTDLNEAEKNLIDTIDEINQTAQQKFRDTFDKVNGFFKELFVKLFGAEAEAELQLTEGDPLEADIEIIAKPPGKRPRSIEGLSGGEKTLTAIALLFAIYLVKPSPFCILDEVDAPLDDANIGRFINLVKDFSKDTQFMIVTHNKKSMEQADSLYGITMEEEGVSKVVSVRLSQENGKT